MRQIKVIIFDCDGVMFDSKKANEAYYNAIRAHFGKPPLTKEECDYVHMQTAEESISYLFRHDLCREAALLYRRQIDYTPFIGYMKVEPYLERLLEYIHPAYKTAISTNRSDTMAKVLVYYGLEKYFDFVVTCLDVERPKPHPESLLKILDYFNIGPDEAIYIGDSQIDEMAASAAGVPLIAYKNPSLKAAFHVSHFKEVEDLLRRLEDQR
nr:HAD family hydrolase [Desulfobacterales bacterium]